MLTIFCVGVLQELVELVKNDKIGMFHKSWAPGHGSTNYTRYYDAAPGEVYRVQGYTHSYEPYVIYKKEGSPWSVIPSLSTIRSLGLRTYASSYCRCDERFIGYGGNKAACLFELYLSGVSFYVLPDDFLIHQSHAYAEKARKHERKYNRKLYTDFREELCFRYLNSFLDQIESPRAKVSPERRLRMQGALHWPTAWPKRRVPCCPQACPGLTLFHSRRTLHSSAKRSRALRRPPLVSSPPPEATLSCPAPPPPRSPNRNRHCSFSLYCTTPRGRAGRPLDFDHLNRIPPPHGFPSLALTLVIPPLNLSPTLF